MKNHVWRSQEYENGGDVLLEVDDSGCERLGKLAICEGKLAIC